MAIVIVEIKARCSDPAAVRHYLVAQKARLVGRDHQIDTYYVVDKGRLKLREGTIENTLIHYHRPVQEGPKRSDVTLFKTEPASGLKRVLDAALTRRVVVDKSREIYFIDNVKFHIDEVDGLGSFVEIEAIDEDGQRDEASLNTQCESYMRALGIENDALMPASYSEMMLQLVD